MDRGAEAWDAAALGKLKDAVGGSASSSQAAARYAGGVGKRVAVAAAVLVAVGVGVVLGWQYWSSSHRAPQAATVAMAAKSIAVLPFTDMSEKKDQEYFADGMAEEIIDLLVKIPGLKVISRTSSFQFKGQAQDLRRIGTHKIDSKCAVRMDIHEAWHEQRVGVPLDAAERMSR